MNGSLIHWTQKAAAEYASQIDPSITVPMDDPRILHFDRIRVYCRRDCVSINPRLVWATLRDGSRVRCDLNGFPVTGISLRGLKTQALEWATKRRINLKRMAFFDALDPLDT